ncbi:MAG: peptidoglycan DD-metalloendopeptidase family protein [Alphaproteobacteria bacterium]|nr:peptidoglycan DD-metalloendopeptidase family protein [Alphaproteobacteria bacterium]
MKKKISKHHVISGGLFFCGLILGIFLIVGQSKESRSSAYVQAINGDETVSSREYAKTIERSVVDLFTGVHRIELNVQSGDTLSALLEKAGVPYNQRQAVIASFKDTFDIRTLRPDTKRRKGDRLRLHYKDGGKEGLISLEKLEVYRSSIQRFYSERKGDGYKSWEETFDPAVKVVRREGVIGEGQSFIAVAQAQGIPYNIIDQFYDILGFDLDFERDIRAGAKFSVLYEEKYGPDGKYIGDGAFLFGEFKNSGCDLKIYRHEMADGKIAYYNAEGKGAQKALRKTPINGARVSSPFGLRRHPILGYTKKHQGVDFAASAGTPIPAAGSGRVVFEGKKGGYGNYIKIRHNGMYETAYAHLRGFKKGVHVGSTVKQGEIVGYVGSTGRSTGPHLHYEILKNGVHVNPLTVKMPSVENLDGKELVRFKRNKEKVDVQFALLEENMKKYAQNLLKD